MTDEPNDPTDTIAELIRLEVEPLETLLVEVLVALEASGALSRWEIAKAALRAEARLEVQDAVEDRGAFMERRLRLTVDRIEARLGARPEFRLLRRRLHEWTLAGCKGPDPRRSASPDQPEPG